MIQFFPLLPEHWSRVREIYLEGIKTGNATFQQSAPEWEEWDASHLPHSRIIAVVDGNVVGWSALTPVSKRPVYAGVAEVSVYVSEAAWGKGVGITLLTELVRVSEANHIWTLQASIFPENIASVRIHEKCGFRLVGRRERIGKLNGVWRDTVILERRSKTVGL